MSDRVDETRGSIREGRSPLQLILIGAGLIVSALLVWKLSHLLLLVFGAILIGLMLAWSAEKIRGWTDLSGQLPLLISILMIGVVAAGFFLLVGAQIVSETGGLIQRIPDLISWIEQHTEVTDFEKWLEEQGQQLLGDGSFLGGLTGFSVSLVSLSVNLLLVVAGGVYFAAHPEIYRRGFLSLIPSNRRARAADVIREIATALRHWFIGQLLAMLCVGVLTTLGLFLLGVSSAFALGFLAGLLEFVPYVGPIMSAMPAIAVGLSDSPATALWVLGLYILVQQLESLLLTPLIQNRAVHLPPGLTIFSILAFGIVLGPGGIVLGTPLAVVCFTLVRMLWAENGD